MAIFLLVLLFIAFILSCSNSNDNKDENSEPAELVTAFNNVKTTLDELDLGLRATRDTIAKLDFITDDTAIRTILDEIVARFDFCDEAFTLDCNGVLNKIQPAKYQESEGTDVSQQPHNQRIFQNKTPVTSELFKVVEGYQAVVFSYPIIKGDSVAGVVGVIIDPARLFAAELLPIFQGKDFAIFAMEHTSTVLYDIDSAEIGRNTLADTMFQNFPEVLQACRKMLAADSGFTTFFFYTDGMEKKKYFKSWWKTIHFVDSKWTLVYKKEY